MAEDPLALGIVVTQRDKLVQLGTELAQRLQTAIRLLEWWDATNPPDDRGTRLARETRAFLAGEQIEMPPRPHGRLDEAPTIEED